MRHLIIPCTLVLCTLTINVLSQDLDSTSTQNHLIARADSLIAGYQFEKALHLLAKGDSLDRDVLLRTGLCYLRLGTSTAAIKPYERVLQMDSGNVNSLNQLGLLYSRRGEYAEALSSFISLINLDPKNSYYFKQAALMAERLGHKKTAANWFRKVLDLNPADTEASLALGNIAFDMEQYESVDSIVQQGLSVDPQFRPLIVLQARSAFEQQHYESVITLINNLLEKSDTTFLYARLLGTSYFHLHDYYKVINCMSYLLQNRYDQDWVYYYMGIATRELNNIPSSIRWFQMAAQKSISENTKIYYSQLGNTYEQTGDYQSAIRAYKQAYNYSKDGILLYHLARNYDFYYKDKSTALLYYQKYLESEDTIRLAREYARRRLQDEGLF